MAHILAVHPDRDEAILLDRALTERAGAEVRIVDSIDPALDAIDLLVPDLVLVHPFMSVVHEDHLIAYLRTLADSGHVQILRIPLLQTSLPTPLPTSEDSRPSDPWSWMFKKPRKPSEPVRIACDPHVFAADAVHYLARARALREDLAERHGASLGPQTQERRAFEREPRLRIASIASVRLETEQADLINVSDGGVLVRSRTRPSAETLRHARDAKGEPTVIFHMASGDEVRAPGRIVRCHVRSSGDERVYDVAFRFSQSLKLFLPRQSPAEFTPARSRALPAKEHISPSIELALALHGKGR